MKKFLLALACSIGLVVPGFGQMTNVTATGLKIGNSTISTGTVCAVATDTNDNPITVAIGGGGLQGAGQSCAMVSAGAITTAVGGGTFAVADEALAGNPDFYYRFTVTDTSIGTSTSKQGFILPKVPGVTGATFALDHYFPVTSVTTIPVFTFTTGSGAPTLACAGKAFYQDNTLPAAPVLYSCGADSLFHIVTGTGGSSYTFSNGLANASGTVSPTYGVIANTVTQGNDSRVVSSLKSRGTFASGTTYNLNDVVVASGVYYVSQEANNIGNPPASSPSAWGAIAGVSGVTAATISTMYLFGDSTINGGFAIDPNSSVAAFLSKDFIGQVNNTAINGAFQSGITAQLFRNLPPYTTSTYSAPLVVHEGGINDANNLGANTGSVNNFSMELQAAQAWATIPMADRTMASSATASGFAASFAGSIWINSGVVGSPKQSVTQGDTLTFTGTAAGPKVGLTWYVPATGTGTFTVTLNGATQINTCTGTTEFDSFGCNTVAVHDATFFRQEFPVTAGSAYTLVVTNTAASSASNPTAIVSVDTIPTSTAGQTRFIQLGVLKQYLDAKPTDTAAFDTAVKTVTSQSVADNLNVVFADVRGSTPGVNTTTDMAASTPACPAMASNTALHPNKCGYLDEALTVENAATSFGVFHPGLGGKSGTFNGPLVSYTRDISAGNGYDSFWNSNGDSTQANATKWAPLYVSFSQLAPNYQFVATGLAYDNPRSLQVNSLVGFLPTAILYCSAANPLPSQCTEIAFWDTAGNQTLKGSLQIGATTAPTCSATVAGQFQYTQGNSTTKDIVQVCAHDASNVYAWRPIY